MSSKFNLLWNFYCNIIKKIEARKFRASDKAFSNSKIISDFLNIFSLWWWLFYFPKKLISLSVTKGNQNNYYRGLTEKEVTKEYQKLIKFNCLWLILVLFERSWVITEQSHYFSKFPGKLCPRFRNNSFWGRYLIFENFLSTCLNPNITWLIIAYTEIREVSIH